MATESSEKLVLRSKVDPAFSIEVGPRVIDSCYVLKNVIEHADKANDIDINMTPEQLKKFVELMNHFESPEAPMDPEFTNAFFKQFSNEDFKDFCWRANYLDSQRFLEAASQFALSQLNELDLQSIHNFLNVVDDYTPEERQIMEVQPMEFFENLHNHNYAGKSQ